MKQNAIYKSLNEFGLSDNEVKVYLECVKSESSTPFTLSKAVGIPRTTVYDILLNLSLKGLITLEQSDGFQKQQTKVKAKNPFVLREILAKRRKRLFALEADILQFLPSLRTDFLSNGSSPNVQFFEGIEGMKKVYLTDNELLRQYEVCSFENLMPVDVMTHNDINNDIDTVRKEEKASSYDSKDIIIMNDWGKHVMTFQCNRNPDYLDHGEKRYVDDIGMDFKGRICIAGDYVRITTSSEDEVWGLVINSKALASTMMTIFKLIWVGAKPVTKELVASWGTNELLDSIEKIK
jgi:hypothetical protein